VERGAVKVIRVTVWAILGAIATASLTLLPAIVSFVVDPALRANADPAWLGLCVLFTVVGFWGGLVAGLMREGWTP
jgi:hypothetical protein